MSSIQDKVGSRTLEGRRLRRHVLKGAVIVFITAGYSGKKFIFQKVTATCSAFLESLQKAPYALSALMLLTNKPTFMQL